MMFEDVMWLEVTMDDIRMSAIMRRALMEVLRRQQHQA
jgi:predicted RNA-binding protein